MRLSQLKVKIKSLAAEATIIRKEEKKALCRGHYELKHTPPKYPEIYFTQGHQDFRSLYHHRKENVGQEARAALLAYGFLRNVSYEQMESKTNNNNKPNWARVRGIVESFARPFSSEKAKEELMERFYVWKKP